MNRPLEKRRRLLERQWPWLMLTIAAASATAGFVALLDAGYLADYAFFPAVLRGYTLTGVALGLSAVGCALVSFLYSLRKRALQERLPVGTMASWLWAHVYFGLLSLLLSVLHAGFGMVSLTFSSGKLLLLLLLLVVGGGLSWRLVYAIVPPQAAREIGHFSRASSQEKASQLLIEIEKLTAGRSAALRASAEWLSQHLRSELELAQAARGIPPEDQRHFEELARLSRLRHEALERERKQARFAARLQGLRVLHVPVSVLLVLAVPLHVILAYDLPVALLPARSSLSAPLSGFHPAGACVSCHERAVKEWETSMHAHALTSPVMVAQSNLALRQTLVHTSAPDPKEICVACHAPIATALAGAAGLSPRLPFDASANSAAPELMSEGITCAVCHQWRGEPATAGGGLSAFQRGLVPGRTFFGPFDDAVGNAFHRSAATPLFRNPSELCRNCHSVQYDRNGDGKLERGTDLVLQTLFDEWQDYAARGGRAGCVDCHMPVVAGSRAAESARIPFEQDKQAPPRVLRSHAFVAVDYPIDNPALRDATREAREALLRTAASLTASSGAQQNGPRLEFELSVANVGTGHHLPGGFAFVRQMWLEVGVFDAQGKLLASSGRLQRASDDLCDATLLSDAGSGLIAFVSGCSAADPALVNFQQRLLDRVEPMRSESGIVQRDARGQALLAPAPAAHEVVVQHLTGGPVPRVRPATGKATPPLETGETRSFPYAFELPEGARAARVVARLLFRAMPPYFLRALGATQQPGDGAPLGPLVANLELNEMARVEIEVRPR
jgi:hypothetical protein